MQNYIDNTGVQVADVVVGFLHLEKKTLKDVEALIARPRDALRLLLLGPLRARLPVLRGEQGSTRNCAPQALKDIEEGHGETAAMAELISTAIVRTHLDTMLRLNIEYDLLAQESEILKLQFWSAAFELLKKEKAIRFEDAGKSAGCWVMDLADESGAGPNDASPQAGPDGVRQQVGPNGVRPQGSAPLARTAEEEQKPAGDDDIKIIVRSNGTVTYVGKDIAYHLWKFALLGKDFGYAPFYRYPDGHWVWRTTVNGQPDAPPFGHASAAYAVIDTRQSYLQNIVKAAFHTLGYHERAANLHHFAYEVVGLTSQLRGRDGDYTQRRRPPASLRGGFRAQRSRREGG